MPPLTAPTNALISLDPSELNPQNRFQDARQSTRQDQVPRGPEIDPGRVQDFLNQPSDSGDVPAVSPAELTQDSQLRLNADSGGDTNPGTAPTFDNSGPSAGFTTTADQAQTGAPGSFGADVLTARPSNDGRNAADAQQAAQNAANDASGNAGQGNAETTGDFGSDVFNAGRDNAETTGDFGSDVFNAGRGNAETAGNFNGDVFNAGQGNAETAGNFNGDVFNAGQGNAETAGNFDGDVLNAPDTGGDEITPAGANTNEAAGTANDVVNANDAANPDNVAGLPDDGAGNVTTDGTTFSAEERAQFQQLTEQVNALQNDVDDAQGVGGATIQEGLLSRAENGPDTRDAEPSTNDQFAEDNGTAPGSIGGTANDAAGNVLPDNPTQTLNG